ncbi:MAG: DNA polymerase III subunit delta' [Myxococcota bacterium]
MRDLAVLPVDVRNRLSERLRTGRLAHALLFVGDEGSGTREAAQRLAQICLCHAPPRPDAACETCPACRKFEAGTHADLTFLAPEGRTLKVGEIREVERVLRLRPLEGRAKVVVIDRADRMTIEAQNALLKTLEEPPGESKLILLAERPRMLLPTVRSRCQSLRFRPLRPAETARILEAEGLSAEDALWASHLAGGALDRARSLDLEEEETRMKAVEALDLRLVPGCVFGDALSTASDLGADRVEFGAQLDRWALWLRDQILLGWGRESEIAHPFRREALERLVSERSSTWLLWRSRQVLEARLQLELPMNLNATLIAEQLCLAMCGSGRMVPERWP